MRGNGCWLFMLKVPKLNALWVHQLQIFRPNNYGEPLIWRTKSNHLKKSLSRFWVLQPSLRPPLFRRKDTKWARQAEPEFLLRPKRVGRKSKLQKNNCFVWTLPAGQRRSGVNFFHPGECEWIFRRWWALKVLANSAKAASTGRSESSGICKALAKKTNW